MWDSTICSPVKLTESVKVTRLQPRFCDVRISERLCYVVFAVISSFVSSGFEYYTPQTFNLCGLRAFPLFECDFWVVIQMHNVYHCCFLTAPYSFCQYFKNGLTILLSNRHL